MKSCLLNLSVSSVLLLALADTCQACGNSGSITNLYGLGGSTLYVSALSSSGQMTGFSYLSGNTAAHAFLSQNGNITDLGTLGGAISKGAAISPTGAVAGDSSLAGETGTHAALFVDGAVVDLGTLGGTYSYAVAINASHQVAGNSLTPGDYDYEAFLWSEGYLLSLGSLAGWGSEAADLNDAGVVVGKSYNEFFDVRAFLYTNGVMLDLGTLGGWDSLAVDINNAGTVVGDSMTADFQYRAFVWNGEMVDLGTLGGDYSAALAINEAGQILGESCLVPSGPTRGFILTGDEMLDLGTLGGDFARPAALNNAGQVVGQSVTADGKIHAFLWQNGNMVDLNTLLPADSGWELIQAQLINDAGQIVGTGTYQGQSCYFSMVPGGVANAAPQAVVPALHTVQCGEVTLDGSASSDPDGDALAYAWYKDGVLLGTTPVITSVLQPGSHTVSLQVSDPCGQISTSLTTVVVADTTSPTILSIVPSLYELTPPNNQLVPISLSVSAQDNCDSAVASRIVAVRSNGAIVEGDYEIRGDLSVALRAAKSSDGGDRVYEITVESADAAGNMATGNVQVRVPKNPNKKGLMTELAKPGKR